MYSQKQEREKHWNEWLKRLSDPFAFECRNSIKAAPSPRSQRSHSFFPPRKKKTNIGFSSPPPHTHLHFFCDRGGFFALQAKKKGGGGGSLFPPHNPPFPVFPSPPPRLIRNPGAGVGGAEGGWGKLEMCPHPLNPTNPRLSYGVAQNCFLFFPYPPLLPGLPRSEIAVFFAKECRIYNTYIFKLMRQEILIFKLKINIPRINVFEFWTPNTKKNFF